MLVVVLLMDILIHVSASAVLSVVVCVGKLGRRYRCHLVVIKTVYCVRLQNVSAILVYLTLWEPLTEV